MRNILLLVFTGFILTGCTKTLQESWNYFPQDVNLDKYENLQFIKIKPGNSITVHMEENPGTDFFWTATSEEDCTVSLDEGAVAQSSASDGLVGAPTTRTFQVKANKNGTCLVEFINEGGSGEINAKKAIYFVVGNNTF